MVTLTNDRVLLTIGRGRWSSVMPLPQTSHTSAREGGGGNFTRPAISRTARDSLKVVAGTDTRGFKHTFPLKGEVEAELLRRSWCRGSASEQLLQERLVAGRDAPLPLQHQKRGVQSYAS